MKNSRIKLPKKQSHSFYKFKQVGGFLETTTTSSVDPTTTISTLTTTTHIFAV
jgi:hypothetical protein